MRPHGQDPGAVVSTENTQTTSADSGSTIVSAGAGGGSRWLWGRPDPEPEDQADWDKAAVSHATGQLTRVQGMAEKWAGTVTALIGVFSTVAIVGGTEELAKFTDPAQRDLVVKLLMLAGISAFVSVLTASLSAQGPLPTKRTNYTTNNYRDWVNTETAKSAFWLLIARLSGLATAVIVGFVAFMALSNAALPASESPGSTVLLIREDGAPLCGLVSTDQNGELLIGGTKVHSATLAVPVDKC